MKRRFGGGGDFAYAYVIAHEMGHHIENQLGILPKVHAAQQQATNQAQANALSVKLELMADCLAGVWAANADKKWQILEQGDIEKAIATASAPRTRNRHTLRREIGGRRSCRRRGHSPAESRRAAARGLCPSTAVGSMLRCGPCRHRSSGAPASGWAPACRSEENTRRRHPTCARRARISGVAAPTRHRVRAAGDCAEATEWQSECAEDAAPRAEKIFWWERKALHFDDKTWRLHFRVSKTVFNYVLDGIMT
jgi:hypothetical protein